METKTTPETPEAPGKINPIARIELDFDVLTSSLVMRSKLPTVILARALRIASLMEAKRAPEPDGSLRQVVIEYDMQKDAAAITSNASPGITGGIIVMAESMMTQSQVLQRMQAMASKARIVGPGGGRIA